MPQNMKRKTEAAPNDSAKKMRKEKEKDRNEKFSAYDKIDSKIEHNGIKSQNLIAKRQINFATCMKCIEGKYDHSKASFLHNTLVSIIKHCKDIQDLINGNTAIRIKARTS